MERWLESLNSLCGIVFVIDNERFESLSPSLRVGTKGKLPGIFIMVGESVSGRYCGALDMESRVIDCRAADEDEGPWRWCLFA
jgi:hypothetical protein